MPRPTFRIALVGSHEPDYPRNRAIRQSLLTGGHQVFECHSRANFPLRFWILAKQFLAIHPRVDLVFITEGGHRLVPLFRLLASATGSLLVFDPFISRYNTRIEDRKLHPVLSLESLVCLWQDWSSTHFSNGLVFDTLEHRRYFYSRYLLRKPFSIIPVGADETVFSVGRPHRNADKPTFDVLFYGTYIPLQGIQHILGAAEILQTKAPDVMLRLVGDGQTRPEMERLAKTLQLRNLRFDDPVSTVELSDCIAGSDVCLGIFGDTVKAGNVVPNKVVQAAATGSAIITADTPAIRRYFRDGTDIALVPQANPLALADRIISLRDDPARLAALRVEARKTFEKWFSQERQTLVLGRFLARLLA